MFAPFYGLSPQKITNYSQLLASYWYSKHTKNYVQWGMPAAISVEPTTSCNLRCPECPSGLRSFSRPTGMLSSQVFEKIIDQLKENLLYLTFYFQGEPYLHPNFTEMLGYAHRQKIFTSTSTNAHFLNDENAQKTVLSGLNRLIISIDGTDQQSYEAYRIGGKLEKVLAGTQNLLRFRKELKAKTPEIVFQFLVVRPNEHQIEDAKKLAKKIGVDKIVFKTAQIYEYEKGSDLIPTIDRYSRYQKNTDGSYALKNSLENSCWRMWHSCVITWDGSVVPCCFDKDAAHSLGKLSENTFLEIWKGKEYENFRKNIIESRSQIDICKNCSEGTKVWA